MAFDDSDADMRVTAAESIVERILLVDEPSQAAPLKRGLERSGYLVDLAGDAGEAHVLSQRHPPDFIVLELALPGETGFELCAFFKTRNDSRPVLVLTEIDLDAARNLAIWCGADGYLIKPVGCEHLLRVVAEIAENVWRRTHLSGYAAQGSIEFVCSCGQKLSVGHCNAGKAVICPKCKSLVISPRHFANIQGVWKGSVQQRLREDKQAGFYCRRCGHMIRFSAKSRLDHGRCSHCREPFKIPSWIASRQHLYFQSRTKKAAENASNFDPFRFVTIRCSQCQTSYRLAPGDLHASATCPRCGARQESLSIKGAPLSRAALGSTGRLFSFVAGPLRRKAFLLPESGEITIGSDARCQIAAPDAGLSPRHCALRMSAEGPLVRDLESHSGTYVNDCRIASECRVEPGDVIAAGWVKLVFVTARDVTESEVLKSSAQVREHGATETFTGQAKVAAPAAQILQLHWQRGTDNR